MTKKAGKRNSKTEWFTLITEFDIFLFKQGKHYRLYEKLGAHLVENKGVKGTFFAVWAPNAKQVSVIGDFNFWNHTAHPMGPRYDHSGIWELFIPEVFHGALYKFAITNRASGQTVEKFDPFARFNEVPPKRASVVWDLKYQWQQSSWQQDTNRGSLQKPWSVYEVHAGSWKRKGAGENDYLSYRELAAELVPYIQEMGFTHVEFLPLTEFPFSGSWGYQATGYFAPTARFGTPDDLMYLIDCFHAAGIGVIMDWVPSHFPEDDYALAQFDGTALFEHPDRRKGFHPDWKSLIFNYERYEIRSFLISSALFWADLYRIDAIRVDAVASMLYLDYSRKQGEWETNIYGGNENLAAISFLKELNTAIYSAFPQIQMIAEESTSFKGVSRPVFAGGLGFGMKWMMGWMHDTLNYFKKDPIYRQHHQNDITFSIYYAFSENFMLPLSHDEVVHGKGSLICRMPGDKWQQFANLRTLYAFMFTHPGAKLLFMGAELAQFAEWNYQSSLDWHLLAFEPHKGMQHLIKKLNHLYTSEPALYERQFEREGFEWIDHADSQNSIISYLRLANTHDDFLLVVCNFTPSPRDYYRLGVPVAGRYRQVFNSDASQFWGSAYNIPEVVQTTEKTAHGKPFSVELSLPPLAVTVWKIEH